MIEDPAANRLSPAIRLPSWLPAVAAGVLGGAALFDMLPAAQRSLGRESFAWAAAGAAAMLIAVKRGHQARTVWLGWAAGVGVAMHSLLEGVLAAAGFEAGAGMLASAGLLAHMAPESLALFAVLAGSGFALRKAMLISAVPWLLLIAGFGAAHVILPRLDTVSVAQAVAVGAGAFLCAASFSAIRLCGPVLRNGSVALLAAAWVAAQHLF